MAARLKKTPWLHSQPFHVGVYERMHRNGSIVYSFWNGFYWCMNWLTLANVDRSNRDRSHYQSLPWRGLANPEYDRRNIGPFVSVIANRHPKWPHARVLAEAKVAAINRDARKYAGASTKGFEPADII